MPFTKPCAVKHRSAKYLPDFLTSKANALTLAQTRTLTLSAIMPAMLLLAMNSAHAQSVQAKSVQANSVQVNSVQVNACSAGFAETWIVENTCHVGRSVSVKTDDAIHVACDGNGQYSISFFIEPEGAATISGSNAAEHAVCPGNGYVTTNANGEQVLRCNFWESIDNQAKQLEIQLQPTPKGKSGRYMSWQVSELDNPGSVCGVDNTSILEQATLNLQQDSGGKSGSDKSGSGKPRLGIQIEDQSDTAGSGRTS